MRPYPGVLICRSILIDTSPRRRYHLRMMHEKLPHGKLVVKLIALDLDDTLLNRDLTISPRTVSALRAAAARGIFVVIVYTFHDLHYKIVEK